MKDEIGEHPTEIRFSDSQIQGLYPSDKPRIKRGAGSRF